MVHLFLDESGNHSLDAFEPSYPVFVLGGVLVTYEDLSVVEDAVHRFKSDVLGDPDIRLHTSDIRRNRAGFEALVESDTRRRVLSSLNDLVASLPIQVIACAVRKDHLLQRYGALAVDPYLLCLGVVVERFCFAMKGRTDRGTIVAERRGPKLDREIRLAWDLLRLNGTRYVRPGVIARHIAGLELKAKSDTVTGLELADLVLSPLGRWIADKPERDDLAVVLDKLRREPDGGWKGAGLVVIPREAELERRRSARRSKEEGRGPLRSTQPGPE